MIRHSQTLLRLALAGLLSGLLGGCGNIGYYAQAIGGHLAVMRAAQPIGDILRDPASAPALRQELAQVQAMREFASRELALPDNGSYRAYADLGRPYVVWNVFAAPEFALAPKSWCMLMVGCVNYRGYYDRAQAERLGAELRQAGYDVFIGGVPAYSTLGYLDDPVLNTFLRLGTAEVARTVFHELAHQLIFVRDDSVFNESFATAVENEGMRRWLQAQGSSAQRAAFEVQRARKAAFAALIRAYREKFRALYDTVGADETPRRAKAELFEALRRDYTALKETWGGYTGYDRFFGADLNNAKLVSLALYSELVPAFEVLLAEEQHDLPRFYRRVAELAARAKDQRHSALTLLLPSCGPVVAAASADLPCRSL